MGTIMQSKEENILELFFNWPMKEWHFEEIIDQAGITRSKASIWLRKFCKQKIIKRIKPKGKMPHYIARYESAEYDCKKKLFGLNKIYNSEFIKMIQLNKNIKTAILFGSFSRSDWNINSDIDIFIYGDAEDKILQYLNERKIDLFMCKNKRELRNFSENLMQNIIKGNLIKGNIDFVKVVIDV